MFRLSFLFPLLPRLLAPSALLAGLMLSPPAGAGTPAAVTSALGNAKGALLQADGPRAREILAAISPAGLDQADESFLSCALSRLGEAPADDTASPSPGRLAPRLLAAYRRYWQDSVRDPALRDEAGRRLRSRVAALTGQPEGRDFARLERVAKERLRAEGVHGLLGQTGRLRDLMIWRKQTDRVETVMLPDGRQRTKVFYLDDFVSRGWSHFIACGATGTGGWATRRGLFAIVPAYGDTAGEEFRVNFLTHESQHFSDYRRFPGLKGWELEYRAKLAELSVADAVREKTLRRFALNQGDDPGDAHSFADRRVLEALRLRLGLQPEEDLLPVPGVRLRQTARDALLADSARRRTMGAGKPASR
ncbi:MAG: hypothetical protein F8N37_04275 [Telmatospirillum sp.]|nr:hypothetical protein [Telmatospirillum sp.]